MFHITATTTTPPVTVVCSRTSPIPITFIMAPNSMDLTALCLHDGVLPKQLFHSNTMKSFVGLTTVPQQQQPQSQIPSQAYGNYVMGPCQVSFLFSELRYSLIPYAVCYCLLWCLPPSSHGGSTIGVCSSTAQ